MTLREKLKSTHPEFVHESGSCLGCPSDYGFEDPGYTGNCRSDGGKGCTYCWNRKVTEAVNSQFDAKLKIYAAAICDKFEDLLEEHNITIPDEEREGLEDEARIYGSTYERLESEVFDILKKLIASD